MGHPSRPVFDLMLRFAVSEDGRLHSEKYRTVTEEFAATRPAFRWRHLVVSDDLDHVIDCRGARRRERPPRVSRSTDGPENGSMTICPLFTLASRERLNVKN